MKVHFLTRRFCLLEVASRGYCKFRRISRNPKYFSGLLNTAEVYSHEEGEWKWKRCADMKEGRENPGVAASDLRIYVTGGNSAEGRPLKSTECYLAKTDQWTRLDDMYRKRRRCCAVNLQGWIYVFGGDKNGFIDIYNDLGQHYETRVELGRIRQSKGVVNVAVVLHDNAFYVVVSSLLHFERFVFQYLPGDQRLRFLRRLGEGFMEDERAVVYDKAITSFKKPPAESCASNKLCRSSTTIQPGVVSTRPPASIQSITDPRQANVITRQAEFISGRLNGPLTVNTICNPIFSMIPNSLRHDNSVWATVETPRASTCSQGNRLPPKPTLSRSHLAPQQRTTDWPILVPSHGQRQTLASHDPFTTSHAISRRTENPKTPPTSFGGQTSPDMEGYRRFLLHYHNNLRYPVDLFSDKDRPLPATLLSPDTPNQSLLNYRTGIPTSQHGRLFTPIPEAHGRFYAQLHEQSQPLSRSSFKPPIRSLEKTWKTRLDAASEPKDLSLPKRNSAQSFHSFDGNNRSI